MLQNGQYLDSCIYLGTESSYSASEDDCVFLERGDNGAHLHSKEETEQGSHGTKVVADGSVEFVIELQV